MAKTISKNANASIDANTRKKVGDSDLFISAFPEAKPSLFQHPIDSKLACLGDAV